MVDTTVDILIPCIAKDIPMLKLCLEGIKENVVNNIDNIYVVTNKETIESHALCSLESSIFDRISIINELDLVGFTKDSLSSYVYPDRKGWFYQQIIKMVVAYISDKKYLLTIDADHILLKPHKFVDNDGKVIFYTSNEFHKPYFVAIKKLFKDKYKKIIEKSFISDKMLFNIEWFKEMAKEIEEINGRYFLEAITYSYVTSNPCGFSEFETYGTFAYTNHKDSIILKDDNRLMCKEKALETMTFEKIKKKYKDYNSVTLWKIAS